MIFKAKPIQINKVGHRSAAASIVPAKNLTYMQTMLLERKTKIACKRVREADIQLAVEAQVAKQNIKAGYGKVSEH